MKNGNWRRLLALLLVLVMCFSLLPAAAFAEDGVDGDDPGYTEPENRDPEQEETEPHVHEYVPTVTEPSCEAGGYTTWVCACGDYYLDTFTDPVEHTPQSVEAAAPTCTEAGHEAGTVCAVCGEILEGCEEIPAPGHTPEDVEAVPAADEEAGHEAGVVCTVCGEILEGCEEIPVPEEEASSLLAAADIIDSGDCGAQGSNVTWTVDKNRKLTISGTGAMRDLQELEDHSVETAPWWSYQSWIETLEIKSGVTTVGDYMFTNLMIKSVTLPNTITRIGTASFSGCSQLTRIVIPASVTSMGIYALSYCSWLKTAGPVGSNCNIQFGWTREIPDNAFHSCTSLASITIPKGIKRIGESAFWYAAGLKRVSLPEGVTSIGAQAFMDCGELQSVTLPTSLTSIGTEAFFRCEGLTGITLPTGLTRIERSVFDGCSSLTDFAIPSGVEYIGEEAFQDCPGPAELKIPASVTEIGDRAFSGCSNIRSITFKHGEDSQLSLSDSSVFYVDSTVATTVKVLDSENMPWTIERYNWAADNRSVTLESLGTRVNKSGVLNSGSGWELKWKCTGIVMEDDEDPSDLTVEISLTGSEANGKTILVGGSPWLGGEHGIKKEDITKIIITGTAKNRLVITAQAFQAYTSVKTLQLDYIDSIASSAFKDCSSLERVDGFDEYLTGIGASAFENCVKLKSVMHEHSGSTLYPRSLRFVYYRAFYNTALEDFYLMDLVYSVGDEAFPEGVTAHCYNPSTSYNKMKRYGIEVVVIPTGSFDLYTDAFSFNNSYGNQSNFNCDCYRISESWLNRLLANQIFIEKHIVEVIRKKEFKGACRGMAAAAVAAKMGLVSAQDVEAGKKTIGELSIPKNNIEVESFINYYNLAQFLYPSLLDERLFQLKSAEERLAVVEELAEQAMRGRAPFVLGIPDHSVVGYGVEHGHWCIDGTVYDSRILIYDNFWSNYDNLSEEKLNSQHSYGNHLYYNHGTSEWFMPAWNDNRLLQATNMRSVLGPELGSKGSVKGEEKRSFYSIFSDSVQYPYTLSMDGTDYQITEDMNDGTIVALPVFHGADEDFSSIITIPTGAAEYVITPPNGAPDFIITVDDALVDLACEDASQIVFHPDGGFTAADVSGSYDMTLVLNEGVSATPWNQTRVQGTGDGDFSMRQTEDGILIDGVGQAPVTVEVTDADGKEEQLAFRPETESVLVTAMPIDGQDVPVALADEDGDGQFERLLAVGTVRPGVRLDREYVAMKVGEELTLSCSVVPEELASHVSWRAEKADETADEAIAVLQDGSVTAEKKGTAYVVAEVQIGEETYSARCRVDVVEGEEGVENPIAADLSREGSVGGVRLLDTKATVELYKLDYTHITVIPELSQNSAMAGVDLREDLPAEAGNTGWAITNAEFVEDSKNADINKYFTLRVMDDRTLEIIPTDEAREAGAANNKALKSSYKAAITVTVDGEDFTTAPLSLTVKKTVPKVTAKALKFNSFRTEETLSLDFNGMAVDRVEARGEPPVWLTLDAEAQSVTFNQAEYGGTRQSGRLNLTVCPTGWAVMLPVTVSASAASTRPKLTLKPASVSLQPQGGDSVKTTAVITPAVFADCGIEVVSITGGKEDPGAELFVHADSGTVLVTTTSATPSDGKAYTYKVTLGVVYDDKTAATAVLTVKLLAKKAPALTAKAKGTIDLAVPKSPVTITPTLKNVGGNASCALTAILNADGEDVKDTLFRVEGFTITGEEALKELVPAGKQARFTAVVTASYPGGEPVEAKAAFTVKHSAKAPAASVTLKAKGGIDVIRPASAVTITPTVKNLYGWELAEGIVTITRTYDSAERKTVSEDVTARFDVTPENGAYVIAKRAGAEVSHLDKFTVTVTLEGVPSRALALPVKMGSAKVTQSAKTVNLIKTDKFSRGVVKLAAADGTLAPIDWEKTQREFTSPLFDLQVLGAGEVSIGFKNNQIGKAGTVKIPVFLEGNESTKPNATISVSVKLA